MFSEIQVANLGLSKISSSRVKRLNPATTALELHIAENFAHWRRSEITKRRWVFATEDDVQLTLKSTRPGVAKPYEFELPTKCLRPVRGMHTEWKQRGRSLWSANAELCVTMIVDVDTAEMDPLFVEVLACRVAMECTEHVTQSNTKGDKADAKYIASVAIASQANAFIIGPELLTDNDADYDFLTARW